MERFSSALFFFLTLCYFQEGKKVEEEHKATEEAQNPVD